MYRYLCAVVWLWLALPSTAAILNVDTVLGPDNPYQDETITVVDGAPPSTDVTILDGAVIHGAPGASGLDVHGQSNVTMLGGIIIGSPAVLLHDNSSFQMKNGDLDSGIEARDNSKVTIDGGSWGVRSYDRSSVLIRGGVLGGAIHMFGESHAVVDDRTIDITMSLAAEESSTVLIKSGSIDAAQTRGDAEMLIIGGLYGTAFQAYDDSVIRVRGFDGFTDFLPIIAADDAEIHLYGSGLHFDLEDDIGLGDVIVGTLANGKSLGIGVQYQLQGQGRIILHEVPEPGAFALCGVGFAIVVAARAAVGTNRCGT